MKKFLFAILLCTSKLIIAQPVLTSNGINPVSVNPIKYSYLFTAVPEGNSGINQNWNFSNLVGVGISSFNSQMSPVCNQNIANFPTFTAWNVNTSFSSPIGSVASGGGFFYNTSSTEWNLVGMCFDFSNNSVKLFQTDNKKILKFPFTYLDSFSDVFKGVSLDGKGTFAGTTNVKADGYGTITTPEGTFTNALRVKTTVFERDTFTLIDNGQVFKSRCDTITSVTYAWYVDGIHAPIYSQTKRYLKSLTYNSNVGSPNLSVTVNVDATDDFSEYQTNVPLSINQLEDSHNITVSPNPSSTIINISLSDQLLLKNIPFEFFNLQGKLVLKTFNKKINIAQFSKGVYLLKIGNEFKKILID